VSSLSCSAIAERDVATYFHLPQLGMGMHEGTVVTWLKEEGDAVAEEEPVVVIDTSKVETELEAPASGILARIVAGEGDVVPLLGLLAIIVDPGEEVPE
jgi:pyruvate/2-oxoglutarate dehydrogenase complex dihydrolipoamide acyltransferase (E2) component